MTPKPSIDLSQPDDRESVPPITTSGTGDAKPSIDKRVKFPGDQGFLAVGKKLMEQERQIEQLQAERDTYKHAAERIGKELDSTVEEVGCLQSHNSILTEKLGSQTCACGLDFPKDICAHHSPIVAQLQAELKSVRLAYEIEGESYVSTLKLLAAAEQELARARAEHADTELCFRNAEATNGKLEAENEKLREAITAVSQACLEFVDHTGVPISDVAREQLRAALAGSKSD